ncbi:transglycosylase SLT domain-containing protein [Sulfurimonas sp. HSL-1716]|uniref:transglycosylase SLT domain-containing protein n=1 Tax=Hydrocurvibacter sulfurireducens TaxID=3131937 RepID=UPI0031F78184
MKLLLLVSFIFMTSLFAITDDQLRTLQIVRDVARTVPAKNGETYEDTLSAICLTESSAGKNLIGDFNKNVILTKASLGVMQVQVATARFVAGKVESMSWISSMSNAQIANRLLTDVEFSARIAAHYFVILRDTRKKYLHSVSGYNGGMVNMPYYSRVMKNLTIINKLKENKKLS